MSELGDGAAHGNRSRGSGSAMSAEALVIVGCSCDPRHLEVGGYDADCFIHQSRDVQVRRTAPESLSIPAKAVRA